MIAAGEGMNMGMLPPLREELSLHPGPSDHNGAPTWTIRDPVRNRFFRIGWPVFEMLCRWGTGQAQAVVEAINRETTLSVEPEEVMEVAQFLAANQLVAPTGPADTARLVARAKAARHAWYKVLLHNYLFFRIPVVRPDRWLGRALPAVRWMGARWFAYVTLMALGLGLVLVVRQWEVFTATLVDTFTLSGLVGYGVALSLVKVVHELAHAFTAKNYGCRVPTMGVAFLVLWPVLYTDVNETWLLTSRRQRLAVGAAGVVSELALAAWATLFWAFLPDGEPRQMAFMIAAVTWISSLAVNLSPFMRFDGYFLLMDGLNMPNLHPRSFAMARWWLRETLFGLGETPPEPMRPRVRAALVAFAVGVWVYRLVLFLGIAVLVYHFFIKAVGVFLFAVEIGWFVLMPIWGEIKEWRRRGERIKASRRTWFSGGAGVALLILAAIPWQSDIEAPAVMRAAQVSALHLPFAARLERLEVGRGSPVSEGQVLMVFGQPDMVHRLAAIESQRKATAAQLEAAQLDMFQGERLGVLRQELARLSVESLALEADAARLTVSAPHDGVFMDPLPDIKPGDWISPRTKLGVVQENRAAVVTAYVRESDRDRLSPGGKVTFYPASLDYAPRDGIIESIEQSPVRSLADDAVSSIHGGQLPSHVSGRAIIPDGAWYRVRVKIEGEGQPLELVGGALLEGERQSVLGRLLRSVLIVLVREWGA